MRTRQLIAGMPDSGKTTFIAALRYLLASNETDTALQLTQLSADEAHLNKLEETWLSCERVPHTASKSDTWVTFHVRDKSSGAEAELSMPDLSGEAFREPVSTGRCRRSLFDAIASVDGIMLFTNADRGNDDLMIVEVRDVIDLLANGQAQATATVPFNPDDMPEEVKLVELLQIMNRYPLAARQRRLALIISAWDVVIPGISPQEWLSQNRPMLAQFLQNNEPRWTVAVFGVSAQGGVLPRDRDALQSVSRPSFRVKVEGPDVAPHDLTAPIRWLMS
jgi:hypothetical protein